MKRNNRKRPERSTHNRKESALQAFFFNPFPTQPSMSRATRSHSDWAIEGPGPSGLEKDILMQGPIFRRNIAKVSMNFVARMKELFLKAAWMCKVHR
jgi:hypothetical protein